jgi:hypothetical protein
MPLIFDFELQLLLFLTILNFAGKNELQAGSDRGSMGRARQTA